MRSPHPNLGAALSQAALWGVPRTVGGLVFWWNATSLRDRSNTGDAAKHLTMVGAPTRTAVDAGYNNQPTYTFSGGQALVSGTWASPLAQQCTIYVVGNIPGAALGGLILGGAETFVSGSQFSTYKDAIAFGILIVILLFRPAGLLGKFTVEKV